MLDGMRWDDRTIKMEKRLLHHALKAFCHLLRQYWTEFSLEAIFQKGSLGSRHTLVKGDWRIARIGESELSRLL